MPPLTAEQRMEFVRIVWENFCYHAGRADSQMSNKEYELARRWSLRGVPLATVLQGIQETTGKPRRLEACERAVEESISRWGQSMMGQTSLPTPGPLEEPGD